MRDLAVELGVKVGQLFSVVRVAVTGQRVSPPLFESMEIIGREKSLERLQERNSNPRKISPENHSSFDECR